MRRGMRHMGSPPRFARSKAATTLACCPTARSWSSPTPSRAAIVSGSVACATAPCCSGAPAARASTGPRSRSPASTPHSLAGGSSGRGLPAGRTVPGGCASAPRCAASGCCSPPPSGADPGRPPEPRSPGRRPPSSSSTRPRRPDPRTTRRSRSPTPGPTAGYRSSGVKGNGPCGFMPICTSTPATPEPPAAMLTSRSSPGGPGARASRSWAPATSPIRRGSPSWRRPWCRPSPACTGYATSWTGRWSTGSRRDGRARRMHHLLYAPDLRTAARLSQRLGRSGNLVEDGRPTLALDARDLLEATLASGDGAYLVPAHIWTPWMGVLSATTGFDSIEACYGELVDHIFAVETGLSADPPMNRRVSALDRFRPVSYSDAHAPARLGREATRFTTELDHFAIRRALETGEGYGGTVEIFPEAGRYHLSGHRRCGVRLDPEAARRSRQACPVCGKRLTMGVQQRVENLADRPAVGLEARVDCRSLVPLPELVGEVLRVGPASKAVARMVDAMIERLCS